MGETFKNLFFLKWIFRDVSCEAGPDWRSVSVSDRQPAMGSTQPSEPAQEMEQRKVSKTFRQYLPDCHRTYSCVHCRAHLANHDELISKSFQGSQGRAYLFNSVVNVGCGPAEERVLLTGDHWQPPYWVKINQDQELNKKYKQQSCMLNVRIFTAGLHAVADIFCDCCKTTLGQLLVLHLLLMSLSLRLEIRTCFWV